MRFVLELVLEAVGQAVLEPLGRPVQRALSRPWRAFVRRLDGRMVLLLWAVALVAMTIAWRVADAETAGGVVALSLAGFMAAPVLAVAATIEWRRKRRRERMHTRRLRRAAN
jgi:hypothetical protein